MFYKGPLKKEIGSKVRNSKMFIKRTWVWNIKFKHDSTHNLYKRKQKESTLYEIKKVHTDWRETRWHKEVVVVLELSQSKYSH